ncbi:MAG: hypothetical protein KDD11_03810, partial [Acidobacteria bacterium]|nr:hypothetical protein [Acidobacteriota bacterium]
MSQERVLKESSDPAALDGLKVIERLEVGPIQLERRRLTAPYTVLAADGSSSTTELVYRFEEDVFQPGD